MIVVIFLAAACLLFCFLVLWVQAAMKGHGRRWLSFWWQAWRNG